MVTPLAQSHQFDAVTGAEIAFTLRAAVILGDQLSPSGGGFAWGSVHTESTQVTRRYIVSPNQRPARR